MDTGEAQWRAGANRQAQPDAASHQQAASRAAAAKRTATAMTGEEKVAADRHRADRRNAAKRAKRAAAAEAAQEALVARSHQGGYYQYLKVPEEQERAVTRPWSLAERKVTPPRPRHWRCPWTPTTRRSRQRRYG